MPGIIFFQNHRILLVFAILIKLTGATQTILNEIVIHPSWFFHEPPVWAVQKILPVLQSTGALRTMDPDFSSSG